jgi:hypothetical protein
VVGTGGTALVVGQRVVLGEFRVGVAEQRFLPLARIGEPAVGRDPVQPGRELRLRTNVSCARSSASAWLPAVSLRRQARTADWWRRTSSANACRSSLTTTRAINAASESFDAIAVARRASASGEGLAIGGFALRASVGFVAGGSAARSDLPILEMP